MFNEFQRSALGGDLIEDRGNVIYVGIFRPGTNENGTGNCMIRRIEQVKDEEKGRRLMSSGRYTRKLPEHHTPARSQAGSYRYFRNLATEAAGTGENILKVFAAPETDSPHTSPQA